VLPNPPFVAQAAAMGLDLDFSKMDGITFDDTFLITIAAGQGADPGALVFHELVHVVQYSVLGVDEFVEQYATGLIASRDYHAIPLELVAYECQARFIDNRAQAFSVQDVVQKTVGLRHT
jgi:hypothetical protein